MFNLEQFGEGVSLVVGIGTPKHAKKPFLKVLAEKRNETKKSARLEPPFKHNWADCVTNCAMLRRPVYNCCAPWLVIVTQPLGT